MYIIYIFIGQSLPRVDTSHNTVMLENQMIVNAVFSQVPTSDEESSEEDEQQNTVKDFSKLSAELSRIQLNRSKSNRKSYVYTLLGLWQN